MTKFKPLFILFTLLVATPVFANVRVPALIGDNMVLQRDKPVKIWGWADAGEAVRVDFNGQVVKTKATKTGAWSCCVIRKYRLRTLIISSR